jgi:hypothetical protein
MRFFSRASIVGALQPRGPCPERVFEDRLSAVAKRIGIAGGTAREAKSSLSAGFAAFSLGDGEGSDAEQSNRRA